jgi:hypothetical protein
MSLKMSGSVAVVLSVWAMGCGAAMAQNWIGGTAASWTTASNWNPAVVPNLATANATITNGTIAQIIQGTSPRVNNLTINSSSSLFIANSGSLSVYGTVNNTGTINIQSGGQSTSLQPIGNVSLQGTGGSISMSTNASNTIADLTNANGAVDTLSVFPGFTIRGAGSIGNGPGLNVTNLGLLHADTTVPLRVRPASLSNAGVLRASNGATLSIETAISNTGTLESLSSSTIEFNGSTGSNGEASGTGRIRATGSTTNVGLAHIRVGALEIVNGATVRIGNAGASRVTTLTINTGGKLDVAARTMIVDYTGTSPLPALRAQLITGRNGGLWNGPGIMTSIASASPGYSVGFVDTAQTGATVVDGVSVDASAVLLRAALNGDTNFDGQILFNDLLTLAANYNASNKGWTDGDFNYDGVVGFPDLLTLAANYGFSDAQFESDWALAQSMVPEPTTMLCLLSAPLMLLNRRRRQG